MENNDRNFIKNIFEILPLLNFVLSLLIVVHHSFTVNVDYDEINKSLAWIIERFFYNISECAVPIFFFMSGYLFYRNYFGTIEDYKYKLHKRIYSILIPYIIFNCLGYVKHILLHHKEEKFSILGLLNSIVKSDTMPLWFLRVLFIFVLLAPIIYWLSKHIKIMIIITFMICCLVSLGIIKYRTALYWFPIYMFGAFLNKAVLLDKIKKLKKHVNNPVAIFIIFLIFFMYAWMLPNSTHNMNIIGNVLFYAFRWISVFLGALVIVFLTDARIKIPKYSFMNYSFWVYCIHFPLISLCQLILRNYLAINISSNLKEILIFILTVIVVYFFSVLVGGGNKKSLS